MSLVVIDADVLGRRRTGDETYVLNLLRHLPAAAAGLRFAALTRRPDLVPDGVEPVYVPARLQELRMAWSVPRTLTKLRPALAHFQHALPLRCPCPAVVTIHDLSFERDPSVMPLHDRLVFKTVVPRSARRAAHVLAVSERTKADIVELYGIAPEKITVTQHGADPAFSPGDGSPGKYVLLVGSVEKRKNPLRRQPPPPPSAFRSWPSGPSATERSRKSSSGAGRSSAATCRRTSSPSSTAAPRAS